MIMYKNKLSIFLLLVHSPVRLFIGFLSRVPFLDSFIEWRELALHPHSLTEEVEANGNWNEDSCDTPEKCRSPLDTHALEHLA